MLKRSGALYPIVIIGKGHRGLGHPLGFAPQHHDPVGRRVRERSEEHRVDDAKHRSAGADSNRQDQDGGTRKHGFAPKSPQGSPQMSHRLPRMSMASPLVSSEHIVQER